MRATEDDGAVPPAEPEPPTGLGPDPSSLAVLEGRASLLEMDRGGIGTPLGDLESVSPR